ncbi:MAG: hypothetical protein GY757_46040, partial [bacterium]|nr:hypothetical protein [bacterium]
MKKIRLLTILLSILTFGLPAADQKPNTPQVTASLWAKSYVQQDFDSMANLMHPEALDDFKKKIILAGWDTAKALNQDGFVSILKNSNDTKPSSLTVLQKTDPKILFSAFLKSLTLSPDFREKMKLSKINFIAHFQDTYGIARFFARFSPSNYASSSRLVAFLGDGFRDGSNSH